MVRLNIFKNKNKTHRKIQNSLLFTMKLFSKQDKNPRKHQTTRIMIVCTHEETGYVFNNFATI